MRIAICGNYGVFNIGDEAILEGLKTAIWEINRDVKIDVMGKGNLLPIGFRSFFRSLFKPSSLIKPVKTIKSCDLFILGGGGLFTDEESSQASLFWAIHGLVARLLGKPVVILGVSFGPLRFWNRWVIKLLFKLAKKITVRDKFSHEFLNKWKIKNELASDLAFNIKFTPVELHDEEKYITVSFRDYKQHDHSLHKNLAQMCDKIVQKFGMSIRLIPFQKGHQNDEGFLNNILDQCLDRRMITVTRFTEDLSGILRILQGASAVIAMRLHAGILSALVGTPFIALSYMKKVSAFWEEYEDVPVLNSETSHIHFQSIVNSLRKILRPDYKMYIRQINNGLVKKNLKNIDILNSVISQ